MPATDSARGFTADLLILDEAAFFPTDDDVAAVLPMRKKDTGRLLVTSTPNFKSGYFWRWWTEHNQFLKIRGHFRDYPELVPLIERERQDLGPNRFQREYDLIFAGSGESAIPLSVLEKAKSGVPAIVLC
jgi:hypothetical protein